MAGELMNILSIANKGLRGFAEPYTAMKMDTWKRQKDLDDLMTMERFKATLTPKEWKPSTMQEAIELEQAKWGLKYPPINLLKEELADIQKAKGNLSLTGSDKRTINYYNLREKEILDELEKMGIDLSSELVSDLKSEPEPISARNVSGMISNLMPLTKIPTSVRKKVVEPYVLPTVLRAGYGISKLLPKPKTTPTLRTKSAPTLSRYKAGTKKVINGVTYIRDEVGNWHPQY